MPTTAPGSVGDLGCGPGQLTATLAARWPGARVVGVGSSVDMLDRAAREHQGGRLGFVLDDVAQWRPAGPVDVHVSNATLQWVPDHRALLGRWVDWLAPHGWNAFQVPGNFSQPSHRLLRELAAEPLSAGHTAGVEAPEAATPRRTWRT